MATRLGNFLQPPPDPLSSTKPLQVPDTLFERLSEETAISVSNQPPAGVDKDSWRKAILTRYAQDNLATKNREVAGRMVKEFNEWIMGKHPKYNKKDAKKSQPTWWGRRRLVGPDFDLYISNILKSQSDFIQKLAILRIGIPENIVDAWMYFTFYVYEWPNMPNGWTPDKLYFDEMKSFYEWSENKTWKSILDTDKDVKITSDNVVEAESQDDEARPRAIGGTISNSDVLTFNNRNQPINLSQGQAVGDGPVVSDPDPDTTQVNTPPVSTNDQLTQRLDKLISVLESNPGRFH